MVLANTKNLLSSGIPNLQPPTIVAPPGDVDRIKTSQHNSEVKVAWYRKENRHHDFSDDDDDDEPRNAPFHIKSDPRHSKMRNFDDLDMAGASTPLRQISSNPNSSISFISPMAKLDNLHLESEIDLEDQDENEEDKEYFAGDKTIENDSESEVEFDEDPEYPHPLHSSPPQYINLRKRQHVDSPDPMVITPNHISIIKKNVRPSAMSLAIQNTTNDHEFDYDNDMSLCTNISSTSMSKISFSYLDSTPCPVQPKRKKLKFKNSPETTPSIRSNKKKMLNLSNSIRTSANSIIHQLNEHDINKTSDSIEDFGDEEPVESSSPVNCTEFSNIQANQATPISQSTPANSRSSTPPPSEPQTNDYGEDINGYKFVKPTTRPVYNYQTPITSHIAPLQRSTEMKMAYNRNEYTPSHGKYQIIGEFPVTSAGMMDESNGDIHIADKRIHDPYLHSTSTTKEKKLGIDKQTYLSLVKLPILPPHYNEQHNLSKSEIMTLITNRDNIIEFYTQLNDNNHDIINLLRAERIRWHPDKWVAKFKHNESEYFFDMEIIDSLSQVLNSIIKEDT